MQLRFVKVKTWKNNVFNESDNKCYYHYHLHDDDAKIKISMSGFFSLITGDLDEDDSENNYLNEMPSNYNYNRRRSRAVLYHLSGHLKAQEKKKKRKLKLNSVSYGWIDR